MSSLLGVWGGECLLYNGVNILKSANLTSFYKAKAGMLDIDDKYRRK